MLLELLASGMTIIEAISNVTICSLPSRRKTAGMRRPVGAV
jgi:hypothetical protein